MAAFGFICRGPGEASDSLTTLTLHRGILAQKRVLHPAPVQHLADFPGCLSRRDRDKCGLELRVLESGPGAQPRL